MIYFQSKIRNLNSLKPNQVEVSENVYSFKDAACWKINQLIIRKKSNPDDIRLTIQFDIKIYMSL
jgi:hypothetical protein